MISYSRSCCSSMLYSYSSSSPKSVILVYPALRSFTRIGQRAGPLVGCGMAPETGCPIPVRLLTWQPHLPVIIPHSGPALSCMRVSGTIPHALCEVVLGGEVEIERLALADLLSFFQVLPHQHLVDGETGLQVGVVFRHPETPTAEQTAHATGLLRVLPQILADAGTAVVDDDLVGLPHFVLGNACDGNEVVPVLTGVESPVQQEKRNLDELV